MKYLVLLCSVVVLMNSCSIDDPEVILIENAMLEAVVPPDQLVLGQTATFDVVFRTPTSCHVFERFEVEQNGQTISVRTLTRFEDGRECEDLEGAAASEAFEFLIESSEDYTFRFLRGASESGQLQFIVHQLPVEVE
jgi:hypothetical protein